MSSFNIDPWRIETDCVTSQGVPSFFINNRLPSRVYAIHRSCFNFCLRQRRSWELMKLQGYVATARSLLGSHKMVFGFIVLPFFGVGLFPSPASYGSCVVP